MNVKIEYSTYNTTDSVCAHINIHSFMQQDCYYIPFLLHINYYDLPNGFLLLPVSQ